MGYQLYQPAISPGFLRQPYGAAYEGALGLIKDFLADTAKQGVQQRFAAQAQLGGLAALGAERGIPQGVSETTATYVASLINAWSEWGLAGTPWSILGLLNFLGYGNVYLVTQNGNVYGPSSAVVIPNASQGVVGVPPAVTTGGNKWTLGISAGPCGLQGQPSAVVLWEPLTSFTNAKVTTNPTNGLFYTMTGTHTSGSTPPNWPTVVGATVSDGGITWTCAGGFGESPVGQGQGFVETNFWSGYLLVFTPLPASWTSVSNPPTALSDPTLYELSAIYTLLTGFNAAHATCAGLLLVPSGTTRATWGWPTGRTNYGDAGMTTPASSASGGLTKFWLPRTVYAAGAQVIPDVPNGYWYYTTAGGTSGNNEPSFPTSGTVTDNSVTWVCGGSVGSHLTGTSSGVTTMAFIPTSQN